VQAEGLEQILSQLPLILSFVALIVAVGALRRASRAARIHALERRVEELERRLGMLDRDVQYQSRQIAEVWKQIRAVNDKVFEQKARLDTFHKVMMHALESVQRRLSAFPVLEVKRILTMLPRNLSPRQAVIIDGSNVARLSPGSTPSVRNLQLAVEWAREQGLHPVIIIERGVSKRLDDRNAARQLKRSGILYTVGVEADEVILELAEQLDAYILSNDTYAEYRNRYPKVDERRYAFAIIEGKLHVLKPVKPQ